MEGDSWTEVETTGENENINIGDINYTGTPKYIHIKSVDGAGNESETYTQKLEPTNQELEVTKEVVNNNKEYKVGDKVTYIVKVKIKENETNKGRVSNVSVVDTYNNTYLKLVKESIIKDNNIAVNTDTLRKSKYNNTKY